MYLSRTTAKIHYIVCTSRDVVREELGCSFHIIRLRKECERLIPPPRRGHWCTLLIFEIPGNQDPTAPENFAWIPQADSHKIRVEPATAGVIEYLKEYKSKVLDINSDRLFPFSHVGWYDNASSWIKGTLARHGHDVQSITQLRSGGDSCVLRIASNSDATFYMKAIILGGWYEELKATRALGEVMAEAFPKPLSYDLDKNWLLMRDYGPNLGLVAFSSNDNPELMRKVLSRLAEIQKKSILLVQRLVQTGVPKLDGTRLRQEVVKMLDDPVWFQLQQEGMSEEEKQRYNDERAYKDEYLAYVDRVLQKLSEYRVPLTLVHGDLETVNIIEDDEGEYVFMDLFTTCISFPFLDVLQYACDARSGDIENLNFYLNFWTEYESMELLRELFSITNDIRLVQIQVSEYMTYLIIENSTRLMGREEMHFTVIRGFTKKNDLRLHSLFVHLASTRRSGGIVFAVWEGSPVDAACDAAIQRLQVKWSKHSLLSW